MHHLSDEGLICIFCVLYLIANSKQMRGNEGGEREMRNDTEQRSMARHEPGMLNFMVKVLTPKLPGRP